MKVTATPLPGLRLIEPEVFGDERGFFVETWRENLFREAGIDLPFVQHNHSRSRRGVLRGLHLQKIQPQGKLVRVARGAVFDVAVDIRRDSTHFGRWHGTILDDTSLRMMYIPPGFAHGFCVLSDVADFLYACSDYYQPAYDAGVIWNDPDIGIEWPEMGVPPVLSAKDQALPRLRDLP